MMAFPASATNGGTLQPEVCICVRIDKVKTHGAARIPYIKNSIRTERYNLTPCSKCQTFGSQKAQFKMY